LKHFFYILTILILATGIAEAAEAPFSYLIDIQKDTAHIKLKYKPIQPDSTVFIYGDEGYGGMKDLFAGIKKIKSTAKMRLSITERKIVLYHQSNNDITITYDIIDTHRPEQKVVGEMFRPISTANYFFSLSHTLFLTPQISDSLKNELEISVTLSKNNTFPVFCAFAPELSPGKAVVLPYWCVMESLVTGADDLHVEKRRMDGVDNYAVLRIRKDNQYNLPRFMEFFEKFLKAMSKFWGKPDAEFYSVVAGPFLDIDYHEISGTAFMNGFHVKYSGDTVLKNDRTIYTVAHEMVHRYIGSGIITMGGDNQWFDEGFTDYTTWYLCANYGIMPRESLAREVARTKAELNTFGTKDLPNSEVLKHFWEGHEYEKLPYYRGALFAAALDRRLGEIGKFTYRDMMLALKKCAQSRGGKLTPDDFVGVVSRFIPEAEIRTMMKEIVKTD